MKGRRRPRFREETADQKLTFMPICIIRGSRVEVTWLNSEEVKLSEAQQIGLVWLNVLKVSHRNWPVTRSVNLMFLNRDRSVRQKPGPRIAPGCSVVCVVCVAPGTAKADALNQLEYVCGASALGLPTIFGRQPKGEAPRRQPEPVGSMQVAPVPFAHPPLPRTAVRGRPVWNVCTPENCHPPRTCPVTP